MCTHLAVAFKSNRPSTEGVLVAKKDYNAPKHEELDVPNLEVIKAMQSLTSKGLVKTQFSWQYYYYTLTSEGVDYLREWWVCFDRLVSPPLIRIKGCISPPKSCPRPTNGPPVPRAPRSCAQVEVTAHTARPVETGMTTGGRKVVHLATTGRSSLALVGVLQESRRVDYALS